MATRSFAVNGGTWTIQVRGDALVPVPRAEPSLASPKELVAAALERPRNFEPLRRALTPDDHVCLVLDERLPHLAEMIAAVLEHLDSAGISPASVTLLTPDESSKQAWIDDLPDEYAEVKAVVHHPADRKQMAFLSTTKSSERIYLNRTAVEAEFVVVLSAHRFDRVGEDLLVPGLSDEAYQKKHRLAEAAEAIWLLGTPFFVRVIEGTAGSIEAVIAGLADSRTAADQARDARWIIKLAERPDLVIVPMPSSRLENLAVAVANAERLVAPGGRVVIMMEHPPETPPGRSALAIAGSPAMPNETVLQALVDAASRVLILDDAHLMKVEG